MVDYDYIITSDVHTNLLTCIPITAQLKIVCGYICMYIHSNICACTYIRIHSEKTYIMYLDDSHCICIGLSTNWPLEMLPERGNLKEETFCVHSRGGKGGLVSDLDHLEGGREREGWREEGREGVKRRGWKNRQ